MANLTNQLGYISNPQFSGGEAVTPLSGSEFAWQNRGYGGLYVGTPGTLVVKTINGNILTLVSASGYIPGLIGAVSASSTAANIIGFDPIPVALPTTTTSTSTTVAPTTSTTTSAATIYSFVVGTSTTDGTGGQTACNNTKVGITITVYSYSATLAPNVIVYTNSNATTLFPSGNFITLGVGFDRWYIGSAGEGVISSSFGICS